MSDRLRVLIVDDVELARAKVVRALAAHADVEVVGAAADGAGMIESTQRLRPDLVMLDISMPGQDGISAFAAIPADQRPLVIFITAHEQFALRAFRVDAVDYLLKPLHPDLLRESLQRVRARLAERHAPAPPKPQQVFPDRLTLRTETGLRVMLTQQIDWIEAIRNYVAIHAAGETLIVRSTLHGLLARVDPDHFVRIHRSAAVNMGRIVEICPFGNSDQRVRLADGTQLAISRGCRDTLLQRLAR